ncbi:MAG: TonB family protein [Acidobacteriota bacterium]
MLKSVLLAAALVLFPATARASAPGLELPVAPRSEVEVLPRAGGGAFAQPVVRSMVLPAYPWAAQRGRFNGLVQLTGVVDETGRVCHLECVDCAADATGFQQAAMDALGRWNYEPARNPDGRPVSVSIQFEVRFQPR